MRVGKIKEKVETRCGESTSGEAKSAYTKDAIENGEVRARNNYAANKMSLTLNKYVVIMKVQPV